MERKKLLIFRWILSFVLIIALFFLFRYKQRVQRNFRDIQKAVLTANKNMEEADRKIHI